jgi:hypothetical protein
VTDVVLRVPESEALRLYQHLHQLTLGQETYVETYRQLQLYFFQTLTVEELTVLLEGRP